MKLPNLIVVGVQRAGTTWLYEILRTHPDVYLPFVKELHFFDEQYDKGLGWYAKFFEEAGDARWRGDITPNYIHDPEIAAQIHADVPDAHVGIVLRHPVDYLFSYHKLRRRSLMDTEDFATLCQDEGYLAFGRFYEKVKAYTDRFPAERLFIGFYEDLRADEAAYLRAICDFLGLDASRLPAPEGERVNPTYQPRAMWLHGPLHYVANKIKHSQSKSLNRLLQAVRPVFNKGFYMKSYDEKETLDPALRARLTAYYADDVARLSDLLGRDLHAFWDIPAVADRSA